MMYSDKAPRSAYLHVPFCRRRCGYCTFTLVAGRDDLAPAYLDALAVELEQLGKPRGVDTLYFGGGTPSHLAPAHLRRLLELTRTWFDLDPCGELSVEANPEDMNRSRLETFKEFGVTRISLGGQSFQAAKLARLDREHTGPMLREAIRRCRDEGFVVSVDLIFAAPGETVDDWRRDLEALIACNPDHASTYGLTYEMGASFWSQRAKGELRELDDETAATMYELAIDTLEAAGYEHYEVSNFAKPTHRCRHNEAYWLGRPYYAAGPGASRYLDGRRETNHRSTTTYIRRLLAGKSPVHEIDLISPAARLRERFVFAMRRREGVDCRRMLEQTGFDPRVELQEPLARFSDWGLITWDGDRLRLTRRGLLISDSMWAEVLLDESAE